MIKLYSVVLLAMIVTSLTSPLLAEPSGHTMRFTIDGLQHDEGLLGINLFRDDKEMFDHPFRTAHVEISKGKAEAVFSHLPFGYYAAVTYHDINRNKKLDHHFIGYPMEPIGYSGGFEFNLLSGMPNFEKLKFQFMKNDQVFFIRVK